MTLVLDYGVGNLRSVQKAVEHLGAEARISGQPGDIRSADRLILPGVGAFGAAMAALTPVSDAIKSFAASGRPLLGICLGQQLLFEASEEHGEHEGLSLLKGKVFRLPGTVGAQRLRVPHIGWNALVRPSGKLFEGIASGEHVFFAHSYFVDGQANVAAWSEYGIEFPAAVESGNIMATQFHPEKSGEVGLRILRNFLEC